MYYLLRLGAVLLAVVLFTGCVSDEPVYRHHRGSYYGGPRNYRHSDVVIYDNGPGYGRYDGGYDNDGYRHDGYARRDYGYRGDRTDGYYHREVNRTNVRQRNIYRTNVYENNRRISRGRAGTANRLQVQTQTVQKNKKKDKKRDHDGDREDGH